MYEVVASVFADDLMLFIKATEDQVRCILEGLRAFCKASGQRVCFQKSQVFFSSNLHDQVIESLSRMLGIP